MRYKEATSSVEFLTYVLANWRGFTAINVGLCSAIADTLKQLEQVETELKALKKQTREYIYDR